jgi:hypothetical protein
MLTHVLVCACWAPGASMTINIPSISSHLTLFTLFTLFTHSSHLSSHVSQCTRSCKGSTKPGGTRRYNRKRNLNRIFYMLNSSLLLVAFGQWRVRVGKMKRLAQHLKIRQGFFVRGLGFWAFFLWHDACFEPLIQSASRFATTKIPDERVLTS